MTQSKITVTRSRQYVGVLARARIDVDGSERATLRVGGSVTLVVDPGHHEIAFRIGRHRVAIAGESVPGSHVQLIADVDAKAYNAYIAAGPFIKMRQYRPLVQRARSEPGFLRLRQIDR